MRLFAHELRSQLRLYWRSRELAFFTFALPLIMFFLLGSVYGDDRIRAEGNVRAADYLLAGMLGYGAIATGFAGLSIMLVIRREQGILKRIRATPLPPATYVAAALASKRDVADEPDDVNERQRVRDRAQHLRERVGREERSGDERDRQVDRIHDRRRALGGLDRRRQREPQRR